MREGARPWAEARGPQLFRILSTMWIISGGLVAAVTGPLGLEHGSCAAAYQVLVGGVVQAGLGAAQYALVSVRPRAASLVAELLGGDIGSVAVIAGTRTAMPLIVDAGGLLLLAALVLLIRTVRAEASDPRGRCGPTEACSRSPSISIPIELALAHLRAL